MSATGAGPGTAGASAGAALTAAFFAGAFLAGAEAGASGKASRSLRWAGASIVDEADLTYSPFEFNHSTAALLVMPSSLAAWDTRTLPGT